MGSNEPKMQELHPRHQHVQHLLSPHRFKKRSLSLECVSLEEQEQPHVSTQDPERKIHGSSKHSTVTELITRYLSTASDTFEKYLPAARSALKKYLPTSREAFDKHVRVLARHMRLLANHMIELPTEWIQYGAGGVGVVIVLYLLFHALFGGPEDGIRVFALGVVPTCFDLFAPTNGSVDISYYYDGQNSHADDTAFYLCDTGFTFPGDSTAPVFRRTCVGDAERVAWNGSAPTCELLSPYCANLPKPAFGSVTFNPTGTFCSHSVYSCDPGYALSDDLNHLNETRECVLDTRTSGVWTGDDIECKVLEPNCPLPQAPANGMVTKTGLKIGDAATFSCDCGFSISPADNTSVARVCEHGSARVGQWSGLQPQCTPPFGNLPFAAAYVVNVPSRTKRVMANLATVGIHPVSAPAVHHSHLNRHELEGSSVIAPESCHMSHTKAREEFLEVRFVTTSCVVAAAILLICGWRRLHAEKVRLSDKVTEQQCILAKRLVSVNRLQGQMKHLQANKAHIATQLKKLQRRVEKSNAQLHKVKEQNQTLVEESQRLRCKIKAHRACVNGAQKKIAKLKSHSNRQASLLDAERAKYREIDEVSQCSVCLEQTASHATLPCGHRCACVNCVPELSKKMICPICRSGVTEFVRIYT